MKKLRYKRVILVIMIFVLFVSIVGYMYLQRSQYFEYKGPITTFTTTYQQDEKIYMFDLKGFQKDEQYYLSLNDLYNWFVIQDSKNKVYVDYGKHTMVYQLDNEVYYIDFGRDEIKYKDDCININKNGSHIYISHKNIYLSVYFIEKILLKNEKKIEIENKNAIIS